MSRPNILRTSNPSDIQEAIRLLTGLGHHAHAALFQAVLAGEIVLASVRDRRTTVRARDLWRADGPVLVLVGDDDDESCGPSGWRFAKEIARWAAAAVVHGAGATPATYRESIRAAVVGRRALLVETSSKHVQAWAELMMPKPVLVVIPGGGLSHPVPDPVVPVH